MKSLGVSLVVLALLAGPVRADPKGMRVLKLYEASYRVFQDQVAKYRFIIKDKGGDRVIKFTLYNKGREGKRLIKFTYPADIRGQMLLMRSKGELYIYLPAYRRVRRVAGHVRNQGFMGSDFTMDDMTISTWSDQYDATLVKEDAKYWYLDLKAKPGRKPPYPRLRMRILKRIRQADLIEYLSASGRKLRTQTFLYWHCARGNSYCSPKEIHMVDHRRGNHKTILREESCRFDVGIPARKFTLRYLLRGG